MALPWPLARMGNVAVVLMALAMVYVSGSLKDAKAFLISILIAAMMAIGGRL